MSKHYALRFKKSGRLATHSISSNGDADFCADVSVCLSDSKYDTIWITRDKYEAESAVEASDDWWNSVRNPYGKNALEVVEIEVKIS